MLSIWIELSLYFKNPITKTRVENINKKNIKEKNRYSFKNFIKVIMMLIFVKTSNIDL